MFENLVMIWLMLMCAKKSSTEKAVGMVGIGICTGIGFILGVIMVTVAYGALVLGADPTTTLVTLIILIILVYVVFYIASAIGKKYGTATSGATFLGIGFTIGLIVITLVLTYFDIFSSVSIETTP